MSTNISTTELSENSVISFAPVPPGQFIALTHYKPSTPDVRPDIDYIEYQPLAGYGVVLESSGEYTFTTVQPMFMSHDHSLTPLGDYAESHTEAVTTAIVDRAPEPTGRHGERVWRP